MRRVIPLLPAACLALAGCDGHWVPYTTDFGVSASVQIRQAGPFVETRFLDLQDFRLTGELAGPNVEIDSVVITALGASVVNVLPTSTATGVVVGLGVSEPSGQFAPLTEDRTFSISELQALANQELALALDPSGADPLLRLRDDLNRFLREEISVPRKVAISGTPLNGRFDADLIYIVELRVSYRKCEKIAVVVGFEDAFSDCAHVDS